MPGLRVDESLLERSARFIDDGVQEGPRSTNPVDRSFHEVADGLGIVCSFSHLWALETTAGLAVFDTSLPFLSRSVMKGLRSWRRHVPVHSIVYTHGHVDHVGGAPALLAEATERGWPQPRVLGHAAVEPRFDRYDFTQGFNRDINQRQSRRRQSRRPSPAVFTGEWVRPEVTYEHELDITVGDTQLQLMHFKGETDDHTVIWQPERRMLFAGDLVTWVFPNAGNPQKVQRYPREWAAALRQMIRLGPELLLPAHGLPVQGAARITGMLDNMATALEGLVTDTVEMMNAGAALDEIIHTVRVPPQLIGLPYMRPIYDEPEFVVRNIWRLYGGWYDGNPARLKPAADAALAAEVAALAGGAGALAERAQRLAGDGELRVACQLAEWAAQAEPDSADVHARRAAVYRARRDREMSQMARSIYADAAHSSEDAASGSGGDSSAEPTGAVAGE